MFASWRISEVQTDSGTGRVFDAAEMLASGKRSSSYSACKTCRARKLRCNGAERGCLRCQSTQTVCTYPSPASSSARHRKKSKTRTSSRHEHAAATDGAPKSPANAAINARNSVEPQNLMVDVGRWDDNEDGQIPDWPFIGDADYTWSGFEVDSAVVFEELRDSVSGLASPPSSVGLFSHAEPSPPEEHRNRSLEAAPGTAIKASGIIDNCHCLNRSARVLDQLNAPGTAPSPATTDQLVVAYRSASQVLHDLQDCSSCCSRSEVAIIVVMVLQQLLALCELMVDRQASGMGAEDCELRFGRIVVTSAAERNSLSHALISAQCQNFVRLFERFKDRAALMPGPLALLRAMEPRISSLQARN